MSVITPVATTMRRIAEQDNPAIAAVIRTVSAEYGLTADKGYTVADPNLDELYQLYSQPGHAYWVIEQNGQVVGGGGVAPLSCSEAIGLYEHLGFEHIDAPLGCTGHVDCEVRMLKSL